MIIDLYYTPDMAPCRAVLLVAAALNIDKQIRLIDVRNGEEFYDKVAKINPQETVPIIIDDGFVLWESATISRYLVNKYGGKDNPLYPSDPKKRALVDQRLDFDFGTLYPKFAQQFFPQLFEEKSESGSMEELQQQLKNLDTYLADSKYVAGPVLTIADLSIVASISTMLAVDINIRPHHNILRWYDLVRSTAPGYKRINEQGIRDFLDSIMKIREKVKEEL